MASSCQSAHHFDGLPCRRLPQRRGGRGVAAAGQLRPAAAAVRGGEAAEGRRQPAAGHGQGGTRTPHRAAGSCSTTLRGCSDNSRSGGRAAPARRHGRCGSHLHWTVRTTRHKSSGAGSLGSVFVLHAQSGEEIPFGLCVWSTGVGPTDFTTSLPFAKTPKGAATNDIFMPNLDGGMCGTHTSHPDMHTIHAAVTSLQRVSKIQGRQPVQKRHLSRTEVQMRPTRIAGMAYMHRAATLMHECTRVLFLLHDIYASMSQRAKPLAFRPAKA